MTRKQYGAVRTALWHAEGDLEGVELADACRKENLVQEIAKLKRSCNWDPWLRNQLKHTIHLRCSWY